MDLKLHFSVIWRFKWLIAVGFVLALLLAVLSVARIQFAGGSPRLAYRGQELWMSHETLLVTQSGFPIGQSIYNEVVPLRTGNGTVTGGQTGGSYVPRYADNGRFASLAVLYARLANSDPVERLMLARGPIKGAVSLSAVGISDSQAGPLPLIQVTGMGTSSSAAVAITHRASDALRSYIADQQVANKVPEESRVVLGTVKAAGSVSGIETGLGGTTLVAGHSKTKPLMIFVLLLGMFVAVAFVLENLRPRIALVDKVVAPERLASRRSA